jgi:hypothetical protein
VEAPGGGRLILGTSEVQNFGVRYDRRGAEALPLAPHGAVAAIPGIIGIRDSKAPATYLSLPREAFAGLVRRIKNADLDL